MKHSHMFTSLILSCSMLLGLPIQAQETEEMPFVPSSDEAIQLESDIMNETVQIPEDEELDKLLEPYRSQDPAVLGGLGFVLSEKDEEAAAIYALGLQDGQIRLFDADDPMTLEHFKLALDYIDTSNFLRKAHEADPLLVSTEMMAISAVQTGAARKKIGHPRLYNVGENLAWGYALGQPFGAGNLFGGGNPFDGWYTMEKEEYEKTGNENVAGHYFNIINKSYQSTGFALSPTSDTGYGPTFGQVFSSYDDYAKTPVSTAEMRKKIQNYQAHLYDGSLEPKAAEGTVLMYRLYNPNSGEHFYTSALNERNSLIKAGWNYEGYGWTAPVKGKPVYRLYNANAGDHHYTKDKGERDSLIKVGWKDEGIGWYSPENEKEAKPLYRQYNPNAKSGSHNYTTNKAENDQLVKAGWKAEGIGWYGL